MSYKQTDWQCRQQAFREHTEQYGPCLACAMGVDPVMIDPRGGQLAGMYYEVWHLTPAQDAAYRIGGKPALLAMLAGLEPCRGKRYGR